MHPHPTGSSLPGERTGHPLVVLTAAAATLLASGCMTAKVDETRQVAAVHAGWRGVLAGVVPAAVGALCRSSGASPARLCAALFPHIRSCCFQVDAALAQARSAD